MSLQTIYQELRALAPPASVEDEHVHRLSLFRRLLELLRETDLITHPELAALLTLLAESLGRGIIPVELDQLNLPTLSFVVWQQGAQLFPMIMVPEHYLDQVREDPLHQLGGVLDIASRVRDYLCGKLAVQESATRASAWEAELLLHLAPRHEQEGVVWSPNEHQQQVLWLFPLGLRSLAPTLWYPTPALLIVNRLPQNDEQR